MAEGSKRGGRDAAEAGGGSDWFARELGETWVEVEPGIYEQRPVPNPPEEAEAEHEGLPQEPSPSRHR